MSEMSLFLRIRFCNGFEALEVLLQDSAGQQVTSGNRQDGCNLFRPTVLEKLSERRWQKKEYYERFPRHQKTKQICQ